MFEDEKWRVIEEFPHYLISTHGRVRHQNRVEARKITINDRGFPIVVLFGADSKTRYLRQVNKLVADAFLPPSNEREATSVWHIDGDLTNCRLENLMWETRSRVLEWNEMHRTHKPKYDTPRVKNNRTGEVYANAYECAVAEGLLESKIVWRIETQSGDLFDENARYRYLLKSEMA